MAKSLRSKWKRKMKAAKRVRYGEKERARLDKMLADFKESEQLKKEQGIELHRPQVLGEKDRIAFAFVLWVRSSFAYRISLE